MVVGATVEQTIYKALEELGQGLFLSKVGERVDLELPDAAFRVATRVATATESSGSWRTEDGLERRFRA
jgi:hypothetical protein